jgi:Cu-processing system permease protein
VRIALLVAVDLLREAASRRWFLALGGALTLLFAVAGLALRMEVVDGALAATRFFGTVLTTDIRPAEAALGSLYRGVAYVVFYGGVGFGIIACADFAPSLLAPGRIEHLLALPVRRWQLLVGTFLGVLTLAVAGALYGAGGLSIVLGIKTGVWTARPVLAALIASASFAGLYGAMLASTVFARSAALSAAVGSVLFGLGLIAGSRKTLAGLFEEGMGRTTFETLTIPLPRLSQLADAAASLAASAPVNGAALGQQLAGLALFGFAWLSIGIWRFEAKDY